MVGILMLAVNLVLLPFRLAGLLFRLAILPFMLVLAFLGGAKRRRSGRSEYSYLRYRKTGPPGPYQVFVKRRRR